MWRKCICRKGLTLFDKNMTKMHGAIRVRCFPPCLEQPLRTCESKVFVIFPFYPWVCFSSTFPSFFTLFTHTKMLLARQYTQKENAKMWAKERLYWWALISKKHLFMMLTLNLLDALNTHRYTRCQYITEIYTNTCLISSNLGNQNLAWYERNAWQPTESDPYANFHSSNLIYDILGR